MVEKDNGLENLLELDGDEIHFEDSEFWTKFEAKKVEAKTAIPHGIKYSLTLHDKYNRRVVGFDNAHSPKLKKKYGAQITTWDHKHVEKKVSNYEFESPGQLLEDFWAEVDKYLLSI